MNAMRPTIALAALALVLAGSVTARTSDGGPRLVVATITDGDTLTLRDGRRVRLLQIDTPELGGGECYSRAARTALLSLVPVGSAVTLEADPALDKFDRYGRLLRYVRHNGLNVNIELVRRGAAAPYFYRGERGLYASSLLSAAEAAKSASHGFWRACPGTRLEPNSAIHTVSARPTPTPTPNPAPAPAPSRCHPSYVGACLDPAASDYDCVGGSGNGPLYTGRVQVVGPDVFGLDSDGDRIGCEDS